MALRIGGLRAFSHAPLAGLVTYKHSAVGAASIMTRAMSTYGEGMTQQAMMESDLLIAVDENDNIVPDTNLTKKEGHAFSAVNPRAILHRAFSLFLFDAEGRLFLTQRAKSKLTFPSVWTNTCCSHPLLGMMPNEADETSAYPAYPGIKHAAIRKCQHELGIPQQHIDHSRIQFITRFHYWAADTKTYGTSNPPWGEHEVDYILFYQQQRGDDPFPVQANMEEVSDYKYVTSNELRCMMKEPELQWSPWFLGIMERGGWEWWADLQGSLDGRFTNRDATFFEPPQEHVADFNLPSHDRLTGVLSGSSSRR